MIWKTAFVALAVAPTLVVQAADGKVPQRPPGDGGGEGYRQAAVRRAEGHAVGDGSGRRRAVDMVDPMFKFGFGLTYKRETLPLGSRR
jgi:hypothetical protein